MSPIKRRAPRRRPAYRKKRFARRRTGAAYGGTKRFTATFKYMDVVSAPTGTNVGGWARNNLAVTFSQFPIEPQLAALYRQYMITGIKWMYRPTNVAPNLDGQEGATQMIHTPDKANVISITLSQAQSQNDSRFLTTAKPFSKYISMPRPTLYQLDGAGAPQLVTSGARQANWIDVGNNSVKYLNSQLLIQDKPDAVAVLQGELWCKMYVVVKEQTL